jgi:hypothetical protein
MRGKTYDPESKNIDVETHSTILELSADQFAASSARAIPSCFRPSGQNAGQ